METQSRVPINLWQEPRRRISIAIAITISTLFNSLIIFSLSFPRAASPAPPRAIEILLIKPEDEEQDRAFHQSGGTPGGMHEKPHPTDQSRRLNLPSATESLVPTQLFQEEMTNSIGVSGAGQLSSPWRVAPSKRYNQNNLDLPLDCSLSNNEAIWIDRARACKRDSHWTEKSGDPNLSQQTHR